MLAVPLEEKISKDTAVIRKEKDSHNRKEKRRALSPIKKLLKAVREDYSPRLMKYKKQNELFGDRNSYSKTDPDATIHSFLYDPSTPD
ncbi:hypothetical protein [Bacillus sp. JJ722]|uniref:hypothetical protein n=1 Tax=Bacillus sp. JJ722 TaxID=3122973 RepID=UPI002FFE8006